MAVVLTKWTRSRTILRAASRTYAEVGGDCLLSNGLRLQMLLYTLKVCLVFLAWGSPEKRGIVNTLRCEGTRFCLSWAIFYTLRPWADRLVCRRAFLLFSCQYRLQLGTTLSGEYQAGRPRAGRASALSVKINQFRSPDFRNVKQQSNACSSVPHDRDFIL